MDRKKIFRSVWFWVGLVIVLAVVSSSFIGGGSSYQQESTSTVLSQFTDGNVQSATINDKEQTLDVVLKHAVKGSTKISAAYPVGAQRDIFTIVNGTAPGAKPVQFDTTSPRTTCWSACCSAS